MRSYALGMLHTYKYSPVYMNRRYTVLVHINVGSFQPKKSGRINNALYKVEKDTSKYSCKQQIQKSTGSGEKKNLSRCVMEFSNDIVLPNEPNRNIIIKIAIRLPTGYST